ncbi:MAG: hypothetical protein PHR53_06395 [Bacteroidales bacterium]|nr:hypothetical protein [Bacteroidales bacterium]
MKKMMLLTACITLMCFWSCNTGSRKDTIDVSKVPRPEISLHRYETALFSIPQNDFENGLDAIATEFEIFLGDQYATEQNQIQLLDFINTPQHQSAWQTIQQKYADLGWLTDEMATAFQRIQYFYPKTQTPIIYTYMSGFDWESSLYIINDTIILGLDNFLGGDFSVYQQLQIPKYISFRMDQPYIVPMIVKTWAEQTLLADEKPKQLLDYMIYCGKELFFLDAVLPDVSDAVKIGYPQEKLAFCVYNEQNIWRYFIEKDVLFSNDFNIIRNYIQEAPYTGGLMMESPGRLGQWVGWQIVKSYMNKNPEISLQQLMQEKDARAVLNDSGYKPK